MQQHEALAKTFLERLGGYVRKMVAGAADRPVHSGSTILKGGLVLFCAVLAWLVFAKVDIVAVGQGKLVPGSDIQIVQPLDAGAVHSIRVEEGQFVRAGDVLLTLDSTLATADKTELSEDRAQKRINLRRVEAELAGRSFERNSTDSAALFQSVFEQYQANRKALHDAQEEAEAELAAAKETLVKLGHTAPHYRSQSDSYAKLEEEGLVSRLLASDKKREAEEKESDLLAQRQVVAKSAANLTQVMSDYRKKLEEERSSLVEQLNKLDQELAKADHKEALLTLRAPRDGVVKELATHTIGAVTQPGAILVSLVPQNEPMFAEIWLNHEDRGKVREGMPVRIKLTAWPFTKYGMLDGTLLQLAVDASEMPRELQAPGQSSTGYRAKLSLALQSLPSPEGQKPLSSGMQVTAEILLGQQSVLEYLISPLKRVAMEAGREG